MRCFGDAKDTIDSKQLKNKIYLLRFGHTRALLFNKKMTFHDISPVLGKLTHMYISFQFLWCIKTRIPQTISAQHISNEKNQWMVEDISFQKICGLMGWQWWFIQLYSCMIHTLYFEEHLWMGISDQLANGVRANCTQKSDGCRILYRSDWSQYQLNDTKNIPFAPMLHIAYHVSGIAIAYRISYCMF